MDKYLESLNTAIIAGKKRNYKKAIELLTSIICNTDSYPIALLYLGRSYHVLKQYYNAITILEYYLTINPRSSLGYLFAGRSYISLGLYKKAINRLKHAVTFNPELTAGFNFLGLAFLKIKKPEIALYYFEKALKISPKNIKTLNGYLNALLIKAIKYFNKGLMNESKRMFEDILKLRDDAFLPHLYLARIYKEFGDFQTSYTHYEICCDLSPDDSNLRLQKAFLLLQLGKNTDAIIEFKKNPHFSNVQSIYSITPAIVQKISALAYFQKKEYKKAIYFCRAILKENFYDHEIHAIMAESYHALGVLDKAINHYKRCLENSYNLEIHYALLQILWEAVDFKNLQLEIKKILRFNKQDKIANYFYTLTLGTSNEKPDIIIATVQKQIKIYGKSDPRSMSLMGQLYYKYDFPELAENWLIRALRIINDDPLTFQTILKVLKQLNKFDKLQEYYELYLGYYPADWIVRKSYIKLLIKQKEYYKVINELNKLLPYKKNIKNLKLILYKCYIKINKFEDAIVIIKTLLKEKPESIDLLHALIYCLDKTGRKDIAIKLLENAKNFFKNNSIIISMLGNLYFKEKKYEKALQIYRNLLADKPNNWRIYRNLGIIYSKMGNDIFAEKFFNRAKSYKRNY